MRKILLRAAFSLTTLVIGSIALTQSASATTYNLTDSSACTLNSAMEAADTNAIVGSCAAGTASDTINLAAGNYVLTASLYTQVTTTGNTSLSINGASATTTIVDGDGSYSGFSFAAPGVNFGVNNITITNIGGDPSFAVLLLDGDATFSRLIVRDNTCVTTPCLIITPQNLPASIFVEESAFVNNSSLGIMLVGSADGDDTNLDLINNTFSNNTGIAIGLQGDSDTTVFATITNNTIANNDINSGGVDGSGLSLLFTDEGSTVNLLNNIIASNTLDGSTPANCGSGIAAAFSVGGNIASDSSCASALVAGTDQNSTDPSLAALAVDGGTYVRAIPSTSAAYNTAVAAGAPSDDQRLLTRPACDGYDVGAYEQQTCGAPTPEIPVTPAAATLAATGARVPILLLFAITIISAAGYVLVKGRKY